MYIRLVSRFSENKSWLQCNTVYDFYSKKQESRKEEYNRSSVINLSKFNLMPNWVLNAQIFSLLSLVLAFLPTIALAQQQPEAFGGSKLDLSEIFQEDNQNMISANEKALNNLLSPDKGSVKDGYAIKAPSLKGGREIGEVYLDQGAFISGGTYALEASSATIRPKSKESYLYEHVAASMPGFKFEAGDGYVDLFRETAVFNEVSMKLMASRIGCDAAELYKYSEDQFHFKDMDISSCNCEDILDEDPDVARAALYIAGESRTRTKPWSLRAKEGDLTREGYAFLEDVTLRVLDTPIFYLPYFVFPLKTERASGLLVPNYGYSNQNGFQYRQPIFFVLDESSDLLLTPFFEAKSRYGSRVQYRELFSKNHQIESKFIYSDESKRRGQARGLVNADLDEIDDNRLGLYLNDNYQGSTFNFLGDIHYVSDDYFLREIGEDDIGVVNSPFTSSQLALTSNVTDNITATVSGEYNQSLVPNRDDDAVLQRLPEVSINANKTLRPFGTNRFGLKTNLGTEINHTKFDREQGYRGDRTIISPSISMPFRYRNYFTSNLSVLGTHAEYTLDQVTEADAIPDSNSRTTAVFRYDIGTSFEKVSDLDPGFLQTLTGLGVKSQASRLSRVKSTIDPFISYIYAPDTDKDLPLFDTRDRIRQRNLVTYGVTYNLLGRFNPIDSPFIPVDDLYSRPDNYETFGIDEMVPNYSMSPFQRDYNLNPAILNRREVRSVLSVTLRQSYDLLGESISTEDPENLGNFTDYGLDTVFAPNNYFNFNMESNFSKYTSTINSWAGGFTLADERNDSFALRYTYIDPNDIISNAEEIKNLVGRFEAKLSDRFRLAYTTTFDLQASEIIRQITALKYVGDCNCWSMDLGYLEGTNPDSETLSLRVNLVGIGDINQDIYNNIRNQQNQ